MAKRAELAPITLATVDALQECLTEAFGAEHVEENDSGSSRILSIKVAGGWLDITITYQTDAAKAIPKRPEDDPAFLTFWEMFGRIGPRKVAFECWQKARRKADAETILLGLERWVRYWITPGAASVKWPQGWLNEERWNDEPPTVLRAVQAGRPNPVIARMRARFATEAQR